MAAFHHVVLLVGKQPVLRGEEDGEPAAKGFFEDKLGRCDGTINARLIDEETAPAPWTCAGGISRDDFQSNCYGHGFKRRNPSQTISDGSHGVMGFPASAIPGDLQSVQRTL
jgi:hypothetical protein